MRVNHRQFDNAMAKLIRDIHSLDVAAAALSPVIQNKLKEARDKIVEATLFKLNMPE